MDLLLLAPYDIRNPLPTLFEVFALEELQLALKNALSVGIFTAVDRAANYVHPAFARMQNILPEIELMLALVIEGRFLSVFDATTCQRLFGLKLTRAVQRSPVISRPSDPITSSNNSANVAASMSLLQQQPQQLQLPPPRQQVDRPTTDPRLPPSVAGISFAPISRRHRVAMLLEAAVAPYLARRFEHWYTDWTDDTPEGRERRALSERTMPQWRLRILGLVAKAYPIVRAVFGVARVAAWLAYMANKTAYPSLTMLMTKMMLTRRTVGDETLQRMSAGSNRLLMLLTGVITWTIVGFEVADWWYRDGGRSSVLRDRRGLPPPPSSADNGSGDNNNNNATTALNIVPPPGNCPICRSQVVNPCVNIATGYVCCFPCLSRHVREHGTCPVKPHIRVTTRHIRRLFVFE